MDHTFSAFPAEKLLLRSLFHCSPGEWGVEVGCLLGSTTVDLALTARTARKKLLCVDPWDGSQDGSGEENYRRFLDNTREFADHVRVARGRSAEVELPPGVGFVFVDGDHSPAGCLADLERFWGVLLPGGTLAVHDAFDRGWGPGIRSAIDEFADHRRPITATHSVYYPTPAEEREHAHGVSGLTIFTKH